jgi:quercetin dioxygenase-like cupin family protein
MRVNPCSVLALVLALVTAPALAQTRPVGPVRTPLAAGHLTSVIGMPLFFRLYEVGLPAARHASYDGSSVMLYGLAGASTVDIDGTVQPLAEGAGAFIPAGRAATITASGPGPATLLVFVLTARPNQRRPLLDLPAVARELFRTPEPLPGLKSGPYAFTLTRTAFPAGMPANPPHYRSGAALYYVLAGTGMFTADGKTEKGPAGTPHFEPAGWVHQWANPGDTPLVLLQANISAEGVAAVLPANK